MLSVSNQKADTPGFSQTMIAFISDLHLTPDRPDATGWFENFMTNAIGMIDEIYILGDLFEVWIGDDASDVLGQGRVEEIIRSTSERWRKTQFHARKPGFPGGRGVCKTDRLFSPAGSFCHYPGRRERCY